MYIAKYQIWLVIFAFLFSWSPLVIELIGINGNYLYLIPLAVYLLINYKTIKIEPYLLLLSLFLVISSVIPALYYEAFRYILIPIYILMAVLIMSVLTMSDIGRMVSKVTSILLLFEILAIISFVFYFYGLANEPLFCIENEDSRLNCLYGATMTNSGLIGNFIRPSAIYDEPGAFSFVICSIVLLRESLRMDRILTVRLLFFGMITFSLAHFLFIVLYLLNLMVHQVKINLNANFFLKIIAVIIILVVFRDVFYDHLISRFEFMDGKFSGDNRSERMANTLSLIDFKTLLVGIGPSCVLTGYECDRYAVGVFGSNPFTLLTGYGIFLSLPYYSAIVTYLYNGIKDGSIFLMLGAIMLILQRPSVFAFGYSLIIIATILLSSTGYRKHLWRKSVSKSRASTDSSVMI